MAQPFELNSALSERRKLNRFRERRLLESPQQVEQIIDGQSLISFCSNDYLGLANHPDVKEAFIESAKKDGVGSGASHLVNGHHEQHHLLEQEIAEFVGVERALLFSTGYMANIGTINALIGKGDTVLEDKLNHASLLDAGLTSGARFKRYQHLDTTHLLKQLTAVETGKCLVVTDGIFSMDGDQAPLDEISQVAKQNNAWVMVDDAHGFGTCGPKGRGSVAQFGLASDEIQIQVGTLGKAFGTFGAFVAGSHELCETLTQFARSYIYTTALPPAVAAATRASLKLLKEAEEQRAHLNGLTQVFKQETLAMGYELWPSESPIQPILVGKDADAIHLSNQLQERGFLVTAIRPPTVPEGSARLRVTFSAQHTKEHLEKLLAALYELRAEVDLD